MKNRLLPIIIAIITLTLLSCDAGRSSLPTELTDEQQNIVDTVLANCEQFEECNGIRFSEYNGETYFVASYTNDSGVMDRVHYFTVTPSALVEQKHDPYVSQTAYGAVTHWDNNWDDDIKEEKLSTAINAIAVTTLSEKAPIASAM